MVLNRCALTNLLSLIYNILKFLQIVNVNVELMLQNENFQMQCMQKKKFVLLPHFYLFSSAVLPNENLQCSLTPRQ